MRFVAACCCCCCCCLALFTNLHRCRRRRRCCCCCTKQTKQMHLQFVARYEKSKLLRFLSIRSVNPLMRALCAHFSRTLLLLLLQTQKKIAAIVCGMQFNQTATTTKYIKVLLTVSNSFRCLSLYFTSYKRTTNLQRSFSTRFCCLLFVALYRLFLIRYVLPSCLTLYFSAGSLSLSFSPHFQPSLRCVHALDVFIIVV